LLLIGEGRELRTEVLQDGTDAGRDLTAELRDVRERSRSERGEVSRDEALERSVLARPRPVPYPVARRDVWVIGVAVVPAAGRRGGDEVRVRADESPDQPVVRSAERADRLRDVRDDVVFLSRRARVRRGQPRNDLRVDAAADLQAVPRAALEILRRDRERVEVAGRDEMQRPAHEARAHDGALLLDRLPQGLALEVPDPRP